MAVVGDTVLLLSDVQEEIGRMRAAGQQLPQDPVQQEALARQVVDSKINDLVLVEAARDEKLTVDEQQVNDDLEKYVQTVRQRFPSEAAFEQALQSQGLTLPEFREMRAKELRDHNLVQQYLQSQVRGRAKPVVSEEQIRKAFEERSAGLGTRPATVSLRQVVVEPEPTDSAKARAIATAREEQYGRR